MSEIDPINSGSDPSAMGGNIVKTSYPTLGEFGLGNGNISPAERTDINQEVYREMLDRIATGEFNIPVEDVIPVICVDGRLDENGQRITAPSGAGGTFGLSVARNLSGVGLLQDGTPVADASEVQLTEDTVERLGVKHSVSVHDAEPCHCGACAQCLKVYEHISKDIDKLSSAVAAIGVEVSEDNKTKIAQNAARSLSEGKYFASNREEPLNAAKAKGATEERLADSHKELAIAVNGIPGTTIDRVKIREVFGEQYDVFVVDAWAIPGAAQELAKTSYEEETSRYIGALAIYNVATASTLSDESMVIVPVEDKQFVKAA